MEKMTSRQEQKIRTQQKIIEAANTCFMRKGMAYTLITDICEEAGVSVGTFYHYFNNKNDLIISQFKKFDMGFLDVAHQLIDNPNALDSLIQFAHFFSRGASISDKTLTLEYLKARVSLTVEQLFPRNRPYFIILCTVIYNGQVRRQIRADRTPQELADLVMAATRGYNFDWASMNGDYDLMSRMQQDMPILFEGFRYHTEYPYQLCAVNEVIPVQNVPKLYEQETAQLREYCESRLLSKVHE